MQFKSIVQQLLFDINQKQQIQTFRVNKNTVKQMGGCKSNMLTQLIKLYGEQNIINYAMSEIGTKFLSGEFSGLKNMITSRFNSSDMFSNTKNVNIFDQIIAQVTQNQNQQINKANQNKPYIKQLDQGTSQKKKMFFDLINKQYKDEVNQYKNSILKNIGDKLDVQKYLKNLNI